MPIDENLPCNEPARNAESWVECPEGSGDTARRVKVCNVDEIAEAIILALRKEVKETLLVTDGSPLLPDLNFQPLGDTEVKVFYNGVLMDEGAADDYQLSTNKRTIIFNYNLVNTTERFGRVSVFYVRSII